MYSAVATPTPDGIFTLLLDSKEVVRVAGFGGGAELAKRWGVGCGDVVAEHPYQAAVRRYYAGDNLALGQVPYAQSGRPLQEAVWRVMRTIAYGTTLSYAEVARAAGYPSAVRAVATACGQNALALLTPCHRVVRSDGNFGSYLYGPDIKRSLLERERTFVISAHAHRDEAVK